MDKHFDFIFNRTNDPISIDFDNNGIAWFRANEIARILGYTRTYDMVRMTNHDENILVYNKGNGIFQDLAGNLTTQFVRCENYKFQQLNMINEMGLYRIAMNTRAKRPEIEEFQHWIFYDVLPNIRMNGGFISSDIRQDLANNPEQVKELIARNEELEHKLSLKKMYTLIDANRYPYRSYEELRKFKQENQMYINVGQALFNNENNITLNQFAKILSDNLKMDFGEHTVRVLLREHGFLIKDHKNKNVPTQYSVDNGWMLLKYDMENKSIYTVITPLGIDYLLNWFKYLYNKI